MFFFCLILPTYCTTSVSSVGNDEHSASTKIILVSAFFPFFWKEGWVRSWKVEKLGKRRSEIGTDEQQENFPMQRYFIRTQSKTLHRQVLSFFPYLPYLVDNSILRILMVHLQLQQPVCISLGTDGHRVMGGQVTWSP